MKKSIAIALCLVLMIAISGCSDSKSRSKGVYMLLDTSGTYALELNKAQSILNYLLGVLQPGDTLAVARIDTGSFSEKDIVAKITFDERPSYANNQKRTFQQEVNSFVSTVKSSKYTDISGGILQAIPTYPAEFCRPSNISTNRDRGKNMSSFSRISNRSWPKDTTGISLFSCRALV
jgi:hypothetical protein